MPAANLDILGSFQDPLNLDQGASKLVNVRVVPREQTEGKQARVRLVGAPGLVTVSRPSAFSCIAMSHALGTIWTGHADGSIYRGVETGMPILAGGVDVDPTAPVIRFAEDRTALAIASNRNVTNPELKGTAYVATFSGVVNAGFDTSINFDPSAVAELDNFTLWSAASNVYANQNSRVYRSQPLQPGVVNPLSFGTKEARADPVIDLAVSGRVLWPLGARSLEQWYNSGATTDMPFIPFPNSLVEVGIASRTTLATIRGMIMFVGTDRRVWRCQAQSARAASTAWVDLLLQQLSTVQLQQLTSYAYGQGGSDFYVLTLPGVWSLEVSLSTGAWSYRRTAGRADHAGRCAVEQAEGITFVGLDTGEVCALDINTASEPAGVMGREIITPWVGSETSRSVVNSIDVTSSMGPDAGSLLLDWSVDRAVTWRGQRSILLPTPGTRRSIGRDFGSQRRRQFRIRYEGTKAPFTIDELYGDVTGGT